jgi:outer membrane receptor protein involved in Fe transport
MTVFVAGTQTGTVTALDGTFSLTLPDGKTTLTLHHLGYRDQAVDVDVSASGETNLGDIRMETDVLSLGQVTVTANTAIRRHTPVALSVLDRQTIETKASNQEFPELLKTTPGVYATRDGGGYGDSRINLRGFESNNIAVMINGVPMNDMEWGGVRWSNWSGLTDVTRTMQVQRGLGASKVSAPSIGGSINIVTRSSEATQGGAVSYTMGNDGYNRMSFNLSTGLSDNGWAMSSLGSRTAGDGYILGTEFESYTWFANLSKSWGTAHHLSLTTFGNSQWHNTRFNGDKMLISEWQKLKDGYRFNPSYGFGADGRRVEAGRNRYHKPQISLNHSWTINDKSSLSTVAYLSIGRGGGYSWRGTDYSDLYGTDNTTGTLNDTYRNPLTGYMDYGKLQAENAAGINGSKTVLAEQRNNHLWTGLISTFTTKFGEHLDFHGGVDFRYYEGLHDARIADLLGGQFFIDPARANVKDPNINTGDGYLYTKLREGDIVYRDNTGYVVQEGVFAQAEYNRNGLSVFLSGSVSNSTYWKEDRFYYAGDEQTSKKTNFPGFSVKGGANYNISDRHNVFFNAGYLSRAPYMDGGYFTSIHTSNNINRDAVNEKSMSVEVGYGFRSSFLTANLNAYFTKWMDRTMVRAYGSDYNALVNLRGVDARHQGVELDVVARLTQNLELTGMLSLGDWIWDSKATGYVYDANGQPSDGNNPVEEFGPDHLPITIDMRGVRVGNSAQTSFSLGARYKLPGGVSLWADYVHYARNYADYSIEIPSPGGEYKYHTPWMIPAAGIVDAGAGWTFSFGGMKATLTANVNNLLDQEYISDARDLNPRVTGAHDWRDVAVMYGFGRTWTIGLKVNF